MSDPRFHLTASEILTRLMMAQNDLAELNALNAGLAKKTAALYKCLDLQHILQVKRYPPTIRERREHETIVGKEILGTVIQPGGMARSNNA